MSLKRKFILFIIFIFLVLALFFYYYFLVIPYQPHPILSQVPPSTKNYCVKDFFKIAVLSDIHQAWEKLEKAIAIINNSDYQVVILLGDITHLGQPASFQRAKEILDKIKFNYYIIPGNHDLWLAKREKVDPLSYWQKYFSSSPTDCFEIANFNLILVNNADEQKGISPSDWQKIFTCFLKKKPTLFFSHIPIFHPASERIMGQYHQKVASQAAELLSLFCEQKLKTAVAGHLHSFAKYTYSCPNGHQIMMLVSGALTPERNFQSPRFLELTFFEDGTLEEKEIILP